MKHLIKIAVFGVFVFFSTSAFAQQQKFGYINFEELIFSMPERDSMTIKLNKLSEDYTSMLELMQVELNNKYQDFQKNGSTYTDAMRQMKERELQELQLRIEELYTTANQEIQTTQTELLAPVLKKAEDAVKKVGRDNGFFAVFDESARVMIYYDESNMTNVMPLVKKELGI